MNYKKNLALFLGLLLGAAPFAEGRAQSDNRFEVSKNLDIFNALVKEAEMFYVDSMDVEKWIPIPNIIPRARWRH